MTMDPSYPHGARSLARIAWLGRLMSGLCAMMAAGAVIFTLVVLALAVGVPVRASDPPRGMAEIAALAGWSLGVGCLAWGLWRGRAAFAAFSRGSLFGSDVARGLRDFVLGLFLYKLSGPLVAGGLLVVLAIAGEAPPLPDVTFANLADAAFTLLCLGAVALITTVLARAAEIAEDNANIV